MTPSHLSECVGITFGKRVPKTNTYLYHHADIQRDEKKAIYNNLSYTLYSLNVQRPGKTTLSLFMDNRWMLFRRSFFMLDVIFKGKA